MFLHACVFVSDLKTEWILGERGLEEPVNSKGPKGKAYGDGCSQIT